MLSVDMDSLVQAQFKTVSQLNVKCLKSNCNFSLYVLLCVSPCVRQLTQGVG